MNTILDYTKINPESIVFSEPKKVKGGSYMTEIKYRNNDGDDVPFIIQTPRLFSSEGIVRNDTRAHLELEFDKSHWPFYEFITNIDDHNIVIIEKHSEKWFTSKFPIDVVEEFYKTPVKLGRGKNPPKLKIKIPVNRGELVCNIFDNVKNPISHHEVRKNNKVVCVMQLVGLRFLKQQVICEWVPLQIKVCKESVNSNAEYIINDSYLSDYEESETQEENIHEPIIETQESTEAKIEIPTEAQTEASMEAQTDAQTEAPTEASTEASTEAPTEASTEAPEEQETNQNHDILEDSAFDSTETEIDIPSTTIEAEGLPLENTDNESSKQLSNSNTLDTDDLELESIDLSNIKNLDTEEEESKLKLRIDELNFELSEKNSLIERLRSLLID